MRLWCACHTEKAENLCDRKKTFKEISNNNKTIIPNNTDIPTNIKELNQYS